MNYFVMNGTTIKDIYFQFAGDWGITIGWGTYIPTVQGHNITTVGINRLKKHGMTDADINHVNNIIDKYKDPATSSADKKSIFNR